MSTSKKKNFQAASIERTSFDGEEDRDPLLKGDFHGFYGQNAFQRSLYWREFFRAPMARIPSKGSSIERTFSGLLWLEYLSKVSIERGFSWLLWPAFLPKVPLIMGKAFTFVYMGKNIPRFSILKKSPFKSPYKKVFHMRKSFSGLLYKNENSLKSSRDLLLKNLTLQVFHKRKASCKSSIRRRSFTDILFEVE